MDSEWAFSKAAVIGTTSWGTTLAVLLARREISTYLKALDDDD